jgi:hypothetical protein
MGNCYSTDNEVVIETSLQKKGAKPDRGFAAAAYDNGELNSIREEQNNANYNDAELEQFAFCINNFVSQLNS